GRGTRRVEASLRTDEPLLATTRERLAALPEAERLLEGRCPLLESGDDLHQLVARLFVAEGGDIGPVLVGPGLVRTGGVGHAPSLLSRGRELAASDADAQSRTRGDLCRIAHHGIRRVHDGVAAVEGALRRE